MARVAVLVSTHIKPNLAEAIAAGEAPRRDYLELANTLGGKLMIPEPRSGMIYRMLNKLVGKAPAMAWAAWSSRHDYDVILSDQEGAGLILALLFKLTRTQRGHVMISHYLTPAKKQILYRLLRAQTNIDITVCYSSAQEKVAHDKLHLKPDQVSLVLHPADSRFWRPAADHNETASDRKLLHEAGIHLPDQAQVVCSAGLEFRDYPTLMEATRRLPENVRVIIAAASPWSKRKNTAEDVELPGNVQRVSLTPVQLRALYRRSQIVAIPLYDVDFQAGSLVAYEAMACGKPVVIARTRGQNDIVREGETGIYTRPGDADSMADALNHLLSDPALAESFGRRARTIVEQGLNLDAYLASMVELVQRVAATRSTGPVVDEPVAMAGQVVR